MDLKIQYFSTESALISTKRIITRSISELSVSKWDSSTPNILVDDERAARLRLIDKGKTLLLLTYPFLFPRSRGREGYQTDKRFGGIETAPIVREISPDLIC